MRCVAASDLCSVLWEMKSWFRGVINHPPKDMHDEAYRAYEEARDKLADFMDTNGIDLDKLYS